MSTDWVERIPVSQLDCCEWTVRGRSGPKSLGVGTRFDGKYHEGLWSQSAEQSDHYLREH